MPEAGGTLKMPVSTLQRPQLLAAGVSLLLLLALAACSSSGTSIPPLTIDANTITITSEGIQVSYDEKVTGTEESAETKVQRTSFYQGEKLVFTAYDTDRDGKDDLWFHYDEDLYLILELRDTDGDGDPDRALHYDHEENVIRDEDL